MKHKILGGTILALIGSLFIWIGLLFVPPVASLINFGLAVLAAPLISLAESMLGIDVIKIIKLIKKKDKNDDKT